MSEEINPADAVDIRLRQRARPMGPSASRASDRPGQRSHLRQYCEALCVIGALTGVASVAPVGYRAVSLIYLLCLVAMSLRLDRGPVLVATVVSALAWDFFVIPPKYSFSILNIDDIAMFGAYVIVALIISELTARIRSQGEHLGAERERANSLAASDRLHRALFDSLSHEFKTPITVLRSATLALRQKTTGDQTYFAEEILQATERLERLVGNLLDQARLESGMLAPVLDWCDPGELIQATCITLQKVLAHHEVRIEISPVAALLYVDSPLLEQALENLLYNAALYSPPGTIITITSGVDSARNRAYISVEDEGPGIPEELRRKLFQKFARGRNSRPGGLGLGLSIVQGFVAAQGGEVEAEHRAGAGAKFTLYLPVVSGETVPND